MIVLCRNLGVHAISCRTNSLVLVGKHYRNGGVWVADVASSALCDKANGLCPSVVVADKDDEWNARNAVRHTSDGTSKHPENVPKPSSLVLTRDAFGHGHVFVKYGTRQIDRETKARLACLFGYVHLKAVFKSLLAGVGVDNIAEGVLMAGSHLFGAGIGVQLLGTVREP